jgi:F0F1-type ATP synthase membrane subunit b/b'
MEKVRSWVRARPVIWVIVAFVLGGIIGGAAGTAGESGLKDEKKELQKELDLAEERQQTAEDKATAVEEKLQAEKQTILAKAQQQAGRIVGDAKAEAEELEGVESEITAKEGQLASVESSLQGAEKEKSLSTFGGGIMKAEVDYTLGATYEAPGGAGCYWALLNSANTGDMAGNEFTNNAVQQIVTIETPYFTSEDCGTWKQIE